MRVTKGTPMTPVSPADDYETVAASQTSQIMGGNGGVGDYLSHVVFCPTAVGAGTSTVSDGSTVLFTHTTGALADLRNITFVAGCKSVNGPWKVTTGANMTATAFGRFS